MALRGWRRSGPGRLAVVEGEANHGSCVRVGVKRRLAEASSLGDPAGSDVVDCHIAGDVRDALVLGVEQQQSQRRGRDSAAAVLGACPVAHRERTAWVPKIPSKRLTWGYCAGGLEDRIGASGQDRSIPSDVYPNLGATGIRPVSGGRRPIRVTRVQGTWTTFLSKPERLNFSSGDWFAGTVEGCQSEASSYNAYSGPFQVDEDKQTEPPRGRARVALEDAAAVSRPQQTGHRQLHGSFGGSLPNYCTTEMGPK